MLANYTFVYVQQGPISKLRRIAGCGIDQAAVRTPARLYRQVEGFVVIVHFAEGIASLCTLCVGPLEEKEDVSAFVFNSIILSDTMVLDT